MSKILQNFLIFLNILVFISITILIFVIGWDTMEQWTYISATGLLILDTLLAKISRKKKTEKNIIELIKKGKIITIEDLKKLAKASDFEQLFSILDNCFGANPDYQYSNLKQNINHELAQGNLPKPAQLQGLLVFLNSEKVKKCLIEMSTNKNTENNENQEAQNVLNRSQETAQKLEKLSKSAKERFSQFCQDKLDFANEQYETLREELKILQKSWKNEMDDLRKSQYARRIKSKQEELNEINQEIKNIEEECQQ